MRLPILVINSNLGLPCTVFEIWRLVGRKTPIFHTSLPFIALAGGEPFRIFG